MTTDDMRHAEQPVPDAEVRRLQRLVGTWTVSGGARGEVTFEWLDGGFFLIQRVDLEQDGRRVTGIEIIGRERKFGEPPGADITSRYYDAAGDTLDYVYELSGDLLTIWGGERGSPAYFEGRFDADGDTVTGAWVYPGGGGYASTMTRVS
jgi:hypothetical protein